MPQLFASEKLNAAWVIKPKISLEVDERTDFTFEGSHNSLILLTYSEASALALLPVFGLDTCNNIIIVLHSGLRCFKTFSLYLFNYYMFIF